MTQPAPDQNSARPSLLDYGVLLFLALVWGNSFLLTKWVVVEMSPEVLAMLRTLCGGALLLVAAFMLKRHLPTKRTEWVWIWASGLMGNALPFFLIGWGQEKVDAGLGAILMGIMPLITLILAHFLTRDDRYTWRKGAAVGIGFFGLLILVGPSVVYDLGNDGIRQLALIGAATCYSINVLITRQVVHLDPIMVSGLLVFCGGLLLIPFGVPAMMQTGIWYSGETWSYVAILSTLPTALAGILVIFMIKRRGVNFFSQINYLVPIFGVMWGWALANEILEWRALIALACILVGIALSRSDTNQQIRTNKPKIAH